MEEKLTVKNDCKNIQQQKKLITKTEEFCLKNTVI